MNKAQPGYARLFINLGKRDGFYPGVLMQTLNRYVGGHQEVGHIDLLDTISYFEVPEKDARKVMTQLTGIRYHGRTVRCNSEDDKKPYQSPSPQHSQSSQSSQRSQRSQSSQNSQSSQKPQRSQNSQKPQRPQQKDWRTLMNSGDKFFKGPEPDFSEEGWARRKPKKKK